MQSDMRVDEIPYLVLQQSMTSDSANGRKGGSHNYQNQFEPPAMTANGEDCVKTATSTILEVAVELSD
jgi:hypothetical protein